MAPFNNNEKLSELVKLYPCFYNKQEKDFKKEDIKQRAWNELAKELNISNGKEAEQYWQNLKKAGEMLPSCSGIQAKQSTKLTMPEEGHDVCMPLFCFMKEYFFLVWT